MRSTKRLFAVALGLAGLLALLTIASVLAQGGQLGGKLLTGSAITIPAGETIDHDIYFFGGSLTSNGTINGDVVAAGGNIDINGPVKGDVLAAGGRISINGAVSGDVRIAGGQITIVGDVAEDVLATGGQATLAGRVGQDLIIAGGQLTISGSIAGSAVGTVGTYTKSGSITGTDSITATGEQGATFAPTPSNPVLDAIRQFIAVLVLATLALWLVPHAFGAAEAQVREQPVPSFGWGIGALIGYIVLIVVIAILVVLLAILLGLLGFGTLVGIDLFGGFVVISGLTLAFVVACAFVADAVVGLALARVLARRTGRAVGPAASMAPRDRWSDLGLLAVGVGIVVVLTSLPVLGAWAKLLVVLLGLGALWLAWRRTRVTAPAEPPATPVARSLPPAATG